MGLFEAAIAEYSEGMKVQPDYDGAFWRRSCAYAATGQIEEALGDYLMAKKLRETYLQGAAPSAGADFDAKRYAEVGQILLKTMDEAPHRKVTGLCKGYWNWGDEPRERSKLLPPSSGALYEVYFGNILTPIGFRSVFAGIFRRYPVFLRRLLV
jgi:tetratricopeptide (TPR) repeat protein